MHPPLTLFEIHGVAGEIPMDDGMTVLVEIQALLSDRSRSHNEGPEWRVEGSTHKILLGWLATIFGFLLAETHGKAHTHGLRLKFQLAPRPHEDMIIAYTRSSQTEDRGHSLSYIGQSLARW